MTHFLPGQAAKLPAVHHSEVFVQDPFMAGPQLEGQLHDDEISPRHSVASAQRHVLPTDLESGQDGAPEQHGIYWPIPRKMLVSFAVGVTATGAHSAWYGHLNGNIVGNPTHQEWNIRFGSFMAYTTQLALSHAVWVAYRQWVWRGLKFRGLPLHALDAAVSAETSLFSLRNRKFARTLKIAWALAVIAWCMQIPSIFTPATLTVVPSIVAFFANAQAPFLDMLNAPNFLAYSPPNQKNYTKDTNISTESLTFLGPRSTLQRLAALTASGGVIPTLIPPSNHSSYSQSFSGPYVKCEQANSTVATNTNDLLDERMRTLQGTYLESINAFYAFVPSLDVNLNGTSIFDSNGTKITALAEPRLQQPRSAINEMWFTFMRYTRAQDGTVIVDVNGTKLVTRQFFQCKLYHAVYDINLQFDNGSQIVTKTKIDVLDSIKFPDNDPSIPTNLTEHSYSAYFSAFTDQLVGSMGFLNDTMPNGVRSPAFGQIDTAILRSSLLGSNDLDFYFDTNKLLYLNNTNQPLSPQRLLDKALANNQTLPYLIEDLAFNITIALLTNPLLSPNQTVLSQQIRPVNRYAFNAGILWLAYGLAIFFSLLAVAWGMLAFRRNNASHDMTVSTIMSITREPELDLLFPACTHGKQPLPKETLKTTLKIMERAKDGGESLRPLRDRRPSLCPRCSGSRTVTVSKVEEKRE